MKVRNLTLGVVFAGFALVTTPALAQSPKEGGSPGGGGGDRSTGGGGAAGGNAVSSGGGSVGGGGSSSSSSSSSGFGSGGGFSSPSGMSASSPLLGGRSMEGRGRESAPARRAEYSSFTAGDGGDQARPRSNGGAANAGGGGGERAVPRGNAASGSGGGNSGNTNTRSRSNPSSADNNSAGAREVPTWSRPRGDRPATGVATERVGPPPPLDGGGYGGGRYYYPGYGYPYYGYGYGYPYYGYGYGYYPYYSWGLGYGLYSGWGWSPYVGDPIDPYYSGSGGYSSGVYNTHDQGHLKLKVKPRNAKVYVDGYFIGLVDQFDGAFQKLALNGGRHKVEVRAEGYETAEFDVLITPDQTVTFQGELKRIQ